MGAASRLIVNIDVPDLAAGEAFYRRAFGLEPARRFGAAAVELTGLEAPLYLLAQPDGSATAAMGAAQRDYRRHWTPVHLDIAVDDLDAARQRVLLAGAIDEGGIRDAGYGRIATFADPFGHGFCLIQFTAEGYDAIAS